LTVTIPASMLAQAGILNIVVENPSPGGGASSAVAFPVENPLPVLDSVTPLQFRADQTATVLTVSGKNFVNSSTITAGTQTLTTHFVAPTQLTGTFAPPLPLGKLSVKVNNPAPGGGPSNGIDIEITALLPTLTSVTPSSVVAGAQIQAVGTNFGPGSTILL